MKLYTSIPSHVSIFLKAERGADLVTQLLLFDLIQTRAAVADLYTPVPNSARRIYRRIEKDAAKEKAKARRELDERMEAVLRDPLSSEEEKRLARIELMAVQVMALPDDEEETEEDTP